MAQEYLTVRERVERGAALLDEHAPGWENVIDLKTLNLSSCEACVCGQVALAAAEKTLKLDGYRRYGGRFWSMLRFFGKKQGITGGICAPDYGFDVNDRATSYSQLDREWKRLIRGRLQAKS